MQVLSSEKQRDNKKGIVAWLITMVPSPVENVVSILNCRLSSNTVGAIMERMYIEKRGGLSRLVEYTKTGETYHPWKSSTIDGIPWSDELWCGSGDRIFWARKVDGLRVIIDESGREKLVWKERKRPDMSVIRKELGV